MINIIVREKQFPEKEKLELRLQSMNFNKIDSGLSNYNSWELWGLIVVRCYATHFTIHTNGDIDHYEVKKALYSSLTYEINNFNFVGQLLTEKR